MPLPPVGVHVSAAGGLDAAFDEAKALGCTCMQVFASNPRGWRTVAPDEKMARAASAKRAELGIKTLVVHAPYLVNLASPTKEVFDKSSSRLAFEFKAASIIGAEYLVLHMGSSLGSDKAMALRRVVGAITGIFRKTGPNGVTLLLENTAGSGSGFGGSLIETGIAVAECVKAGVKIGMCLDTCHAFAAGYDFGAKAGLSRLVRDIDSTAGIKAVKLIHLNDSKGVAGSCLDRHEHIGKGKIGKAALGRLLGLRALAGVPVILETPKDSATADLKNLKAAREILRRQKCTTS